MKSAKPVLLVESILLTCLGGLMQFGNADSYRQMVKNKTVHGRQGAPPEVIHMKGYEDTIVLGWVLSAAPFALRMFGNAYASLGKIRKQNKNGRTGLRARHQVRSNPNNLRLEG